MDDGLPSNLVLAANSKHGAETKPASLLVLGHTCNTRFLGYPGGRLSGNVLTRNVTRNVAKNQPAHPILVGLLSLVGQLSLAWLLSLRVQNTNSRINVGLDSRANQEIRCRIGIRRCCLRYRWIPWRSSFDPNLVRSHRREGRSRSSRSMDGVGIQRAQGRWLVSNLVSWFYWLNSEPATVSQYVAIAQWNRAMIFHYGTRTVHTPANGQD